MDKYITNFVFNQKMKKRMKQIVEKKLFYKNKNGIYISKYFPNNQKKSTFYSNSIKIKERLDKKYRSQYYAILKLCRKYYPSTSNNNILEVGAGFGRFAELFIKKFKPNNYTICEFALEAEKTIIKKMEPLKRYTNIHIKIEDMFKLEVSNYNCIFAMEVLEHIRKDIMFLNKINKNSMVFISVPSIHGVSHVRAFLTPDSIQYRYKDILQFIEINNANPKKDKYPVIWAAVAIKK
jgi:2-polyprenyl-3-methyl-5-hydroxy-6-metoxy-1,4-benzoquinol methylase